MPLKVQASLGMGCGCLVVAILAIWLAIRLIGLAIVLIALAVLVLAALILVSMAKQAILKAVQSMMPQPPPASPPAKFELWVCGGCGESNPAGTGKCTSCGRSE